MKEQSTLNVPKQEKSRKLVLTVLAFFLSFFSFLLIGAAIVHTTLLNPAYFEKKVRQSSFAEEAQQNLRETFSSYGAAANFEAEVFEPLITQEEILRVMRTNIYNLYGGEAVDYSAFVEKANELLLADVEARGIQATEEIRQGVRMLAESCRDEFRKTTTIPLLQQLIRGVELVRGPASVVLMALVAAAVLVLVLLLVVGRTPLRFLPYFINTVSALALLCGILPTLALSQHALERISLRPETIRLLVIAYGNGVLGAFYPVLGGLVVLLALLAAGYGLAVRRATQNASASQ